MPELRGWSRWIPPLAVIALILWILRLAPLPLEQVFVALFTAILLASAVSPLAGKLQRYKVPRGVTVLLFYLVGAAIVAGVIALIVPLVSEEVGALQDRLPEYEEDVRELIERFAPGQQDKLTQSELLDRVFQQIGGGLDRATDLARSTTSVIIRVIIILVLAYYMAVEADFAERVVRRWVPARHRPRFQRVVGRIGSRLGAWARAQLLMALFFGVFFAIGLRVAGVPYAVTLGVIGGVLEVMPYVGGLITMIIAVLVAATKDPVLIFVALGWYTVVVQVQSHVLAPIVMGKAVHMHPLVVVVALFVGTEALGVYGALLAVPIAVVIQVLLDEFYVLEPAEAPLPSDASSSAAADPAPADH